MGMARATRSVIPRPDRGHPMRMRPPVVDAPGTLLARAHTTGVRGHAPLPVRGSRWIVPGMSDPTTTDPTTPDGKRPRRGWWMLVVAGLVIALVGVGAWALSLRSDVEDRDATIAAQQQQIEEEQQGVAADVREAAEGFADDARQTLSGLGAQLDEIQAGAELTQQDAQAAIARAQGAADDARARVDEASGELDRARAEADAARAHAEALAACARGYLSAISAAFDADSSLQDGVAQARREVEALSGSCADLLGA